MNNKTRTILRSIFIAIFLFSAIVAYAAPGDLDPTFGVGGKLTDASGYGAYDVAIQPDGKIVAVGLALGGSQTTQIAVARYNIDGSPDTTFGGTGIVFIDHYQIAVDVAIQPDGKIVVAGRDPDGDPGMPGNLIRLNSDGSLDTSFGTNGIVQATVPSISAILPDGRLLIAQFARLFRLNSNGSFDMTFGTCVPTGVNFTLHYLYNRAESVIQPDGKIVTAFTKGEPSSDLPPTPIFVDFGAYRCNPNGTLDTTFGSGGTVITPIGGRDDIDVAQSVAMQTDGKIVVAGQSRTLSISNWKLTVVRYHPNGTLDTGFGAGGIVITSAAIGPMISLDTVAIQADGKILASTTIENGSNRDFALVRYNPNGSLDTTFGAGDGIATVDFNQIDENASGMALDRQGRAVVVGTSAGFALARLLLDTSLFSVSGRVTTPDGRGLRNSTVSISDALGVVQNVTTSSFGFYAFDSVQTGSEYTIRVTSKRYRFSARVLQVDGNLVDVDFVGIE